jgi:hypothetical protein
MLVLPGEQVHHWYDFCHISCDQLCREGDGHLGYGVCRRNEKGVFTVLYYEMPVKHNVLTLHSSANEGEDGDVTVFFGLSGTGKTTLPRTQNVHSSVMMSTAGVIAAFSTLKEE